MFYRPYGEQLAFHRSPHFIRSAMGGNRVGKTTMGVAEDIWVASGTHPYIQPPVPNRGRIGVTDFGILEKVLWPKIQELLPPWMVRKYYKGYRGMINGIELTNGSFFDILSYEQPYMKWESVKLDWIHFDEPPPFEIFKASRARLIDSDGRMWFTLTPLEQPWMLDEIWEKCQNENHRRFWGVMLAMCENPYLSREAVQRFHDDMPPEDREARFYGKFRHLTGKVFKMFRDSYPYVMDRSDIQIGPNWDRMMVLDPHEKTPWALQWYARDPDTDTVVRIDDERFDPVRNLEEFGHLVRNTERLHNAPVPEHMRIVDTYAAKPIYNAGGSSLIDEISRICGLDFRVADKTDKNGRLWDLIYRYQINPTTRMPRLVTLSHCEDAIREIDRYVWDRHRTKAGEYQQEKQTPVAKDDHAISCDHYMAAEWPSTGKLAVPYNTTRTFNLDDPMDDWPIHEGTVIDLATIQKLGALSSSGRRRRGRRYLGGMS